MSPKSGVAPLFLLLLSTIVSGDGDNISPESLADTYGNTADADSVITWAELEEEVYERSDYSDGQLEGFLKMKDNFIKTLKKEMLDPSKLEKHLVLISLTRININYCHDRLIIVEQ